MDAYAITTLAIGFVLVIAFVKFLGILYPNPKYDVTRFMARVAVFGAISTILYVVPVFQLQLPFLPFFLKIHFDEIPAFIAGFAYGPMAGVAVILIKTIIKLPFTETLCVGELSDLLFSVAFILPTTLIYKKMRNLKGVALGFVVGTICQLIVSTVLNVYAMLPFYLFVMGYDEAWMLSACQAVNPNITSLGWPYGLFAILPLNAIKDASVIVVTFLVYRSIHKILHFDKQS